MKQTLVENITKSAVAADLVEHKRKIEIAVTEQIIDAYGAELFPHGHVMIGPVTEIEGVIVEAKTRALNARYSLEMVQDATAQRGPDVIFKEVTAALAQEIAAELRLEIERLNADGKVMVPYQLAIAALLVDPETFTPCMAFKVRYGELAR